MKKCSIVDTSLLICCVLSHINIKEEHNSNRQAMFRKQRLHQETVKVFLEGGINYLRRWEAVGQIESGKADPIPAASGSLRNSPWLEPFLHHKDNDGNDSLT